MNGKFFRCSKCGNIIYLMEGDASRISCCGESMEELIPGFAEASREKHIPCVTIADGKVSVQVGSAVHPMLDGHYIEWIAAEKSDGDITIKYLKPGEEPSASFCITDGRISRVYAYCNLHGLWMHDPEQK